MTHASGLETKTNAGNGWFVTDDGKPSSAPWTSTITGATFEWTGSYHASHNSLLGGRCRDDVTTTIKNAIAWTPGGDAVSVTASIKKTREQWTGDHNGGTGTITGGDSSIASTETITLGTIKNEELDVNVQNHPLSSFLEAVTSS